MPQWFALSASPAYWTGAGILDVFGVDFALEGVSSSASAGIGKPPRPFVSSVCFIFSLYFQLTVEKPSNPSLQATRRKRRPPELVRWASCAHVRLCLDAQRAEQRKVHASVEIESLAAMNPHEIQPHLASKTGIPRQMPAPGQRPFPVPRCNQNGLARRSVAVHSLEQCQCSNFHVNLQKPAQLNGQQDRRNERRSSNNHQSRRLVT